MAYWHKWSFDWAGRDFDKRWGPFLYARDKNQPREIRPYFNLTVRSSGEGRAGYVRLSVGSRTLLINIGSLLPPIRRKVKLTYIDEEQLKRLGRDYRIEEIKREYGFYYERGFLNVKYGASTMDSETDKSRGWFMPWIEWRTVRERIYDVDGDVFGEFVPTKERRWWNDRFEMSEKVPKKYFCFKDYDGEFIIAKTHVTELVQRWGTTRLWWMGYLRKPRVRTSMEMRFNKEVGKRKGSWKGGTIGTSIDVRPDEDQRDAFKRWCDNERGVVYVGNATASQYSDDEGKDET